VRVILFRKPGPPRDIPIAGVTLLDLLGEQATAEDVCLALDNTLHRTAAAKVQPGDEIRQFRTPAWTWATMAGMEGFAVLRAGNAVFLVVTRMN
jgi:hypothetical protein